jgi:hypothetical protein
VRALNPLRPALPRQLRATPPLRAKQPTKLLHRHHLANSIFHASRLSLYLRLSKLDNHQVKFFGELVRLNPKFF